MNKNNKKTMNERTHNSFDTYKEAHNTNSNTNDPGENRTQEFAKDFDAKVRNEQRDNREQ
jgi:gas vesicle protein